MNDATYRVNPYHFEAKQFTGGEENAKEILAWLVDHNISAGRWEVTKTHNAESEHIILHSRRIPTGTWVVFNTFDPDSLELHKDEQFKEQFLARDEAAVDMTETFEERFKQFFSPTQQKNDSADEPEPGPVDEGFVGIEKELEQLLNRYSAESISGTPDFILAKFLIETLKAYNEAVSHRASWRGESCELPVTEDVVVTNGIIDSVPGAEGVSDRYDENTLVKVRGALMAPGNGISRRAAEIMIQEMQNAGILFRERD
jgi:hypothetical protein